MFKIIKLKSTAGDWPYSKVCCSVALIAQLFLITVSAEVVDPVSTATRVQTSTVDKPTHPLPRTGVTSTEAALSINEPMYFVVGGRGDTRGRFQFSFKYRVFDEGSEVVQDTPWLKGFHFAYTQTSLWNLSANSAPFEDSSYRPSFFLDFNFDSNPYLPDSIRSGYEHESNGRDGEPSRSINTFFFWPFWNGKWQHNDWMIAPKLYAYFATGDYNKDIKDYRGYGDLWLSFGNEDGWSTSAVLRHAGRNRSSIQLDFSLPIRKKIFSRAGGYVYVQLFHGYGESLITYDQKQDLQFRIGFAIVR